MAVKKIEIRPKGTGNYTDVLYPRTDIGQVDGLDAALTGKAAATHTHDGTDITQATTAVRGTVQLSSATNSTSVVLAATASAVKAAYDLANGKAAASHTHTTAQVTGLDTRLTGIDTAIGGKADALHIEDDIAHNRYAVATGTNALVATPLPAITALTAGISLRFKNTTANTGAVTLNVNGRGAKPVVKNGDVALTAGNLKAGGIYTVLYDGASFILEGEGGGGNPIPGTQTFSTPGTYSFTVPDGVSRLIARIWGAGGGGGGNIYPEASTTTSSGGGGGGGAFLMVSIPVISGSIIPVSVGYGGASSYYGSGQLGGSSAVGGYTAFGGGGGGGSDASNTSAKGGRGGTLSAPGGLVTTFAQDGVYIKGNIDTHIIGMSGGDGDRGGGGSPSDLGVGVRASSLSAGGIPSLFVHYGGGYGGIGSNRNSNNSSHEATAGEFGGGGGSGFRRENLYQNAANGGPGKVILSW